MGSTLRTINDVVNQNNSSGYTVVILQVLISLGLMWYVVRRARYELNKVCLPPTALKQNLRHSKSAVLNGFKLSSANLEEYDPHLDLEELKDKNEHKPGHKRAQSASAVLIDVNNFV